MLFIANLLLNPLIIVVYVLTKNFHGKSILENVVNLLLDIKFEIATRITF